MQLQSAQSKKTIAVVVTVLCTFLMVSSLAVFTVGSVAAEETHAQRADNSSGSNGTTVVNQGSTTVTRFDVPENVSLNETVQFTVTYNTTTGINSGSSYNWFVRDGIDNLPSAGSDEYDISTTSTSSDDYAMSESGNVTVTEQTVVEGTMTFHERGVYNFSFVAADETTVCTTITVGNMTVPEGERSDNDCHGPLQTNVDEDDFTVTDDGSGVNITGLHVPDRVAVGEEVTAWVNHTEENNPQVEYYWDEDAKWWHGKSQGVIFNEPGVYEISVDVETPDENGETACTTIQVGDATPENESEYCEVQSTQQDIPPELQNITRPEDIDGGVHVEGNFTVEAETDAIAVTNLTLPETVEEDESFTPDVEYNAPDTTNPYVVWQYGNGSGAVMQEDGVYNVSMEIRSSEGLIRITTQVRVVEDGHPNTQTVPDSVDNESDIEVTDGALTVNETYNVSADVDAEEYWWSIYYDDRRVNYR